LYNFIIFKVIFAIIWQFFAYFRIFWPSRANIIIYFVFFVSGDDFFIKMMKKCPVFHPWASRLQKSFEGKYSSSKSNQGRPGAIFLLKIRFSVSLIEKVWYKFPKLPVTDFGDA